MRRSLSLAKRSSSATPASTIVNSPPRSLEFRHPRRDLHALVDALGGPVEHAVPVDRLLAAAFRGGNGEADGFDRRAAIVPEVEADVALVLQGGVEHALARQDAAVADLLGGAVLRDADFIAVIEQAAAQLQAGLTASDNSDPAFARHMFSPTSLD